MFPQLGDTAKQHSLITATVLPIFKSWLPGFFRSYVAQSVFLLFLCNFSPVWSDFIFIHLYSLSTIVVVRQRQLHIYIWYKGCRKRLFVLTYIVPNIPHQTSLKLYPQNWQVQLIYTQLILATIHRGKLGISEWRIPGNVVNGRWNPSHYGAWDTVPVRLCTFWPADDRPFSFAKVM